MTRFCLRSLVLAILSLIVFLPFAPLTQAASDFNPSFGVATVVPLTEKSAKDGALISVNTKGAYVLTSIDYDSNIAGVVSENPAVVFSIDENQKFPIISTGNVYVLVSTVNGPIKSGDLLASSTTPGVAMKATKTGFVIGSALEDYTASNPKEIGKIMVTLNIHYNYEASAVANSFFDIVHLSTIATHDQPVVVLKYSLGGILLIVSFIIAFMTFAKSSQRGIEAIGRNPLAAKMIQLSILLNVVISIAIVLAGFGLAYVVVKF